MDSRAVPPHSASCPTDSWTTGRAESTARPRGTRSGSPGATTGIGVGPQDHAWLEETANTLAVHGLAMSNLTAAVLRSQFRSATERPAPLLCTEVSTRTWMR